MELISQATLPTLEGAGEGEGAPGNLSAVDGGMGKSSGNGKMGVESATSRLHLFIATQAAPCSQQSLLLSGAASAINLHTFVYKL